MEGHVLSLCIAMDESKTDSSLGILNGIFDGPGQIWVLLEDAERGIVVDLLQARLASL
jgi:hypothetical protein